MTHPLRRYVKKGGPGRPRNPLRADGASLDLATPAEAELRRRHNPLESLSTDLDKDSSGKGNAIMILSSDDLTEWVSTRKDQLVVAWTPQIEQASGWESPFAEVLADELHTAMVTTMTRGGTEVQFLKLVARSNTGLGAKDERTLAERFYDVTLKLARASRRKKDFDRSSAIMPLQRAWCVNDGRTDPGHLALDGIVLPCDHPFWKRWSPPLSMDCRCSKVPMTMRQFERSGLVITSPDELAWREERLSASWPQEFEPLLEFRLPSPTVDASPPSGGIREAGTHGGDVFDAVLRATSLEDISHQLRKMGF